MRVFCLANDKEEVGKLHEQERDTHKLWHGNCFKVYFGAENQTLPDKDMPFRIISYDGATYRSQLLKTEEKRVKGKLRQVPSKKRHPVISIVLYFGEKPWKYPKNLVDCFEPPLPENKVTDILRKYIQDYKVHVFDIPRLTPEEVNRFKSDFRIVAEHFVHAYTDEDYVPEDAVITHVDEFLKLMKVLTGDQRYEEAARSLTEEEKEVGVMSCRVLDYREAKGRKEGEARLSKLISELLKQKKYDEIEKVTSDEEARKEYYTLYNI
ncbi:MAG: Rpn family recombination-promoting nuclease/putative transposase [Lachnospiraceae bacterium]|nr:Rpn family recombination-promoting nuclease/putative transposase [Lachnospiraceae bacterium]